VEPPIFDRSIFKLGQAACGCCQRQFDGSAPREPPTCGQGRTDPEIDDMLVKYYTLINEEHVIIYDSYDLINQQK
jgi:hypothetical protein